MAKVLLGNIKGPTGPAGTGVSDVVYAGTVGLVDTYNVILDDGTVKPFTVTNGAKGEDGERGPTGPRGERGLPGSVNVVSTAASMVDTSLVYVYAGSEAGYTNGNWYYYNGSSWVSGGAYPTLEIETDKYLQTEDVPGDAKAIGDALALKADMYVPAEPVIGAVANFNDSVGDVPIVGAILNVEPMQNGSGTPSSENPRSFKQVSAISVSKSGKNLFNNSISSPIGIRLVSGAWTTNTWITWDSNGYYKTTHSNSADGQFLFNQIVRVQPGKYITVSADVQLTGTSASTTCRILVRDVDGSHAYVMDSANVPVGIRGEWRRVSLSALVPEGITRVYVGIIPGYVGQYTKNIQVEIGESATDYSAFGTTTSVSIPVEAGTLYGCSVDVVHGVLLKTHERIASYSGETLPGKWYSSIDEYEEGTTPSNGAEVVYELAEPVAYSIPPISMTTVAGANNLWGNIGDMAASVGLTIKNYIDSRTNTDTSLLLPSVPADSQATGDAIAAVAGDISDINAAGYVPGETLVAQSFNSAYHSGATDFATKCADFSNLMYGDSVANIAAPSTVESFLFFTDPHLLEFSAWQNRCYEYMAQIQKYYNSTPTSFALCGGDWLGNSDLPKTACFKLGYADGFMHGMFDRYYMLLGNHDTNYQGKLTDESATYTTRLSTQAIRNLWYRETGKAYFKFDGDNTAFYCFDTGIENESLSANGNCGWTQAKWFAQSLLAEQSAHIAIALHILYSNFSDKTVQPLADEVLDIAFAYNSRTSISVNGSTYDFSGAAGRVEFLLAGHSHVDYTDEINGIPCVLTENVRADEADGPTFDLVFVDYDNSRINLVRVGDGANRIVLLNSL